MKRIAAFVAAALVVFMLGSIFTIGVGNYLAGQAVQSPAVLTPSNFGSSI